MKGTAGKQLVKVGTVFALMTGATVSGFQPWATSSVNAATVSQTQSQKQLQAQLYEALSARKDNVKLTYPGGINELKKNIEPALDAAIAQDPYIHYIMKGYAYSLQGTQVSSTATVKLTYRETAEQSAYVHQQVAAALQKIITKDMNDHMKVKAIHDWVVRTLQYDTTLSKFTAYEGLKTGSTVCQGYALLTYDMLTQAGFESNIVEGYVKNEAHAWNMVKLDGKWYQIDTTWDDPLPDRGDRVSTSYYLLTDAQLKEDHRWKTANYPNAVTPYDQTLNALIAKGVSGAKELRATLGYTSSSSTIVSTAGVLQNLVQKAAADGESSLTFKYKGTKNKLKKDLLTLYNYGVSPTGYTSKSLSGANNWQVTLYWKS
ncbi:transglutaminase domain-containing protein [Saccharibacillus sp. JS10]|uniref:transglutaminase domain-containing protein n=1 Tax=Saccharibacillus sp. JS10 TaxID=2950552 RepID=UPI002109104A|nr:transglutaminase domain-containing protein [Saccharibacillus sp. JS10]MCQ4088708.1 transglutaminase [Saccharibacillus sp. JS10]